MTVHLPEDVSTWTPLHVKHWLDRIGEGIYAAPFANVNGSRLLTLTNTELQINFGVRSQGARSNIMGYINGFRSRPNFRRSSVSSHLSRQSSFDLLIARRASYSSSLFSDSLPQEESDISDEDEVSRFRRLRAISQPFLPKALSRRSSRSSLAAATPTPHHSPSNSDSLLNIPSSTSVSDVLPRSPDGWFTGRVVWVHHSLGHGLIEPDQSHLFKPVGNSFLVTFNCSNLPWTNTIGCGVKSNPCPEDSSIINTKVKFSLTKNPCHYYFASSVLALESAPRLGDVYIQSQRYVGYIYSIPHPKVFFFIKTSGFEVYAMKDNCDSDYTNQSVGDIVSFNASWFISKIDQHEGSTLEATILSVIPDKKSLLYLAICEGDNCLRTKFAKNFNQFDIADDIVIIRTSMVALSGSETQLVGQKCLVEVSVHDSGYCNISSPALEPETRLRGIVEKIVINEDDSDGSRNFGFLVVQDVKLDSEVFFPLNKVIDGISISEGALVEFSLKYSNTGKPQAKDIVVLKGGP
ncbi:hypothetical protein GEMRC1_011011 [Eukaryota sp. GEM-RC1]